MPGTFVWHRPRGPSPTRSAQYRSITLYVESVIRRLAPHDAAWTLGEAGPTPRAEWLEAQGKSIAEEEAQT